MKITFKEAFLKKYPKYEKVMFYMNEAFGESVIWSNMTKINLITFVELLCNKMAQSSARTYCAMVKSVLNMYNEEVNIPCKSYDSILNVKNVRSTNTWLTENELERLIEYNPPDYLHRIIRNQFVLGAFTGARHSDFLRFDATNIIGEQLVYVSKKTHIQATVPLKPIALKYLNEPMKEYSDPTFNTTIREICRSVGITERVKLFKAGNEVTGEKWEFVSSHTARRSFATNLYLREADLYSISKMMGHSSTGMTEGYICCGLRNQSDNVMGYFK